MRTRLAAFGTVVVLVCGPAAGDDDAPGEKFVRDYYGKRIAAVRKTPGKADDLALARQVLIHANDASVREEVQYALARAALLLTVGRAGPQAVSLMRQGMDLIETLRPMSQLEKATFHKDIAQLALDQAQADRRKFLELRELASEAIDAHVEFVEAVRADASRLGEADQSIKTIRSLIVRFHLTSRQDAVKALEGMRRWIKARQTAIQSAQSRLSAARQRQDAEATQRANADLARAYLEYDGDLATAAKYLAAANDPRAEHVAAGAAFESDPAKFDPAGAVRAAATLGEIAKALPASAETPRERLGNCAMKLCQEYLRTQSTGPDAAQARLVLFDLERSIGFSPQKRLQRQLTRNYRGLRGALTPLDSGQTRIGYDFADVRQLGDFSSSATGWRIAKGVLGVRAGATTTLTNKFRFHASKAVKLSFRAKGLQGLGGRLTFLSDQGKPSQALRCVLGIPSGARSYHYIYRPGKKATSCTFLRFKGIKGSYAVDVIWNGTDTLTWRVNGAAIGSAPYTAPPGYNTVVCSLETSKSTTYYTNFVVQGTILVDPFGRSASPKPAATTRPVSTQPASTTQPVKSPFDHGRRNPFDAPTREELAKLKPRRPTTAPHPPTTKPAPPPSRKKPRPPRRKTPKKPTPATPPPPPPF